MRVKPKTFELKASHESSGKLISLGQPVKNIEKLFIVISFLIVINSFILQKTFYFMDKSSGANEKVFIVINFLYYWIFSNLLFHGLIHKKWLYVFVSEKNDAWLLFFMCNTILLSIFCYPLSHISRKIFIVFAMIFKIFIFFFKYSLKLL